jgi:hypothetical protein
MEKEKQKGNVVSIINDFFYYLSSPQKFEKIVKFLELLVE